MKKTRLLVLTIGSIALASCGGGTHEIVEGPLYIEVTDMVGRTFEVKQASSQRVVCIGAGALRMYSYVADIENLAGVEDIDNEKAANTNRPKMFDGVARPYYIANKDFFETLPSCGVGGPQAQTAEAEKILSCNPDIIISEYEDTDKANALAEQVGVPVVTLSIGSKGVFDDKVAQSINLLGKIFERETRSESLNEYIQSETEAIRERTKDVTEADKRLTYICGLGNWGTTNHLMTSSNFYPLTVANIKNVAFDIGIQGVGSIEKEKFVELGEKMDVMIMDSAAIKNIKTDEDKALIKETKAWKTGEVYLQMAYNAYYTNVELSLANTWFSAKAVYPSLFEDIDMNAKLDEITTKFNGKALSREINAYPNSFGGYQKIDTATFLV